MVPMFVLFHAEQFQSEWHTFNLKEIHNREDWMVSIHKDLMGSGSSCPRNERKQRSTTVTRFYSIHFKANFSTALNAPPCVLLRFFCNFLYHLEWTHSALTINSLHRTKGTDIVLSTFCSLSAQQIFNCYNKIQNTTVLFLVYQERS